ncbi:hypothetical protein [Intestinibacter sp.]|uniref:hypothetical protein n=1 Tax=Intestinibacter sp. TaxID=1965304 RepID=UPI003F16DF0B
MSTLVRKLLDTLQIVEEEIHHNENLLMMKLECADALQEKVIELLKREDLTNDDKVNTLKNLFMI